jgi:hypothetical protein
MASSTPKVSAQSIIIGVIVIAVGIWMGKEGFDAYRTGQAIHTADMKTMEWWQQIPAAGLIVLVGILMIANGLGCFKSRGDGRG